MYFYLLAILVQLGKLSKQVDERTLAKRVLDGGMEGDGWVFGTQDCHPLLCYPCWNKIDFVQNQNLEKFNQSLAFLSKMLKNKVYTFCVISNKTLRRH